MSDGDLVDLLMKSESRCSAREARLHVPDTPGFYVIFVDSADALPPRFGKTLRDQETELIYLGIATKSLLTRLVEQDLRHRRSSTFFRSIGAVLGFKPPAASLHGRNYKFSKTDTEAIITWIDEHLSVGWTCAIPASKKAEGQVIGLLRPLLNIIHNPTASPELQALRGECISLAARTSVVCGPRLA